MTEKIIISGAGGQGIMLLGKIIIAAAVREDKCATWFPAYGAEVRGGAAYCMVIISDAQIGSPYIEQADTVIAMNAPSLDKFKPRLKNKGLLIINSSLAGGRGEGKNSVLREFPFTDIAVELGNIRVANMVALGCYLANKKTINKSSVLKTIIDMAPSDKKGLVAVNRAALERGIKLK
jgi:2-oxoglutarate ferredoxin oxidoreductase subunit gamma